MAGALHRSQGRAPEGEKESERERGRAAVNSDVNRRRFTSSQSSASDQAVCMVALGSEEEEEIPLVAKN